MGLTEDQSSNDMSRRVVAQRLLTVKRQIGVDPWVPLTSHPCNDPVEVPAWVLGMITWIAAECTSDERGTIYGYETWEPDHDKGAWEIDIYRIEGNGRWYIHDILARLGPLVIEDAESAAASVTEGPNKTPIHYGWCVEAGSQNVQLVGTWEGHFFKLVLWVILRPDGEPEGRMCLNPRLPPTRMGADFEP
jgi:hypothetical protein